MKVYVGGQLLAVRSGKSNKSGKEYTIADIYDGEDLIKVFGASPDLPVGTDVMIECRLDINPDTNKTFFMALTDRDG